MTDTIHITGTASLTCTCGDVVAIYVLNKELHDLTEYVERQAELEYGWGTSGHCPTCQAALDVDAAEVEKADCQRREEKTL